MAANFEGKPPRSPDSIRASIESIRETYQPEVPSGPRSHGAEASDRIAIASFFNSVVASDFQRALAAAGISSTKAAQGGQALVSVDYEDLDRALGILADHQKRHSDQRPRDLRRDYDFSIGGAVMGGSLGLVLLAMTSNFLAVGFVAASLAISGAVVGFLIDGIASHRRRFGHVSFGLREILLFVTACALFLSLPRLFAIVIFR